ncbi:methionine aminopeptidase [Litorimonas cladophorae]|uniref:Methionine aminopeptidase n=1 Tax=Litorimonas cladophorae TaxID=1220491 RepID=A0A918KG78_9PROT|nr:type I methionyl aminopeptidase [Litorimonas cladophorae]GGX59876.1 methionine aminopeptidase [Litorimonas cladophorae]
MNYIDAADAPDLRDGAIKIHTPEDFAGMRKAGQLSARCLDMLVPMVKPGVTTGELDRASMEFILDHGGVPACLGYRGYQHTVCTSVNHVVCHGIPNDKPLKDGDIVNIDVTAIVDGWHGDTSRMYPVGEVNRRAERLTQITYDSLMLGIAAVKPGATTGDIGHAIQKFAEAERCSVVTDFCGHGLGKLFHDSPNILHYGRPGEGEVLREGMFFTIEPMINLGRPDVKILSDGWTAVTRDRKLTAQFEHSIGVTATGCEIFTGSPAGLHRPPYL